MSAPLTRLLQRESLAPRVARLRLDAPALVHWHAGQFVTVRVPGPAGSPVRRAYSLATLPEDGRVELWVERHPGGAAGPWLLDLPVGAELDLSPPRGGFGLLPSPGPEAIFAGEVTGAVPLVAMARRFTREGTVGRASLLLSIPHPDLDICAAVRRAAPGNVPVESASPADVASRLQTLLHDSRDRLGEAFGSTAALYLAGGGAFLDAAWGVVGAVGLSPTRVRQEKFW